MNSHIKRSRKQQLLSLCNFGDNDKVVIDVLLDKIIQQQDYIKRLELQILRYNHVYNSFENSPF